MKEALKKLYETLRDLPLVVEDALRSLPKGHQLEDVLHELDGDIAWDAHSRALLRLDDELKGTSPD